MNRVGISVGGEGRLRKAIEAEVRSEYEKEFSSAAGYWERAAIEAKIQKEVSRRLGPVASPFSLWISPRFSS